MILTCCGDVHADNSNLEKVEKLFSIIERIGNPVVWLGDLFHTKEIIRGKTLNKLLSLFKASNLQHHILVGNHDLFHVLDTESALEALALFDNVTVYKNPTTLGNLGFLPYRHERDEIIQGLREVSGCRAIFMHQGVAGFDYGNGLVADGTRGGEVNLEDLQDFELVVAGHFHRPSELGNVVYVGAPFSHDFGEANMETRLLLLDTNSLAREYSPLDFPKHLTFKIDASVQKKAIQEIKAAYELVKTNPVRVILTGSKVDIKALNMRGYPGLKFSEVATDVGPSAADSEVMAADNQTRFRLWAEAAGIPKKIIDLGVSYLRGDVA